MKKRKQELIGSFAAMNNKQELQNIIVSQDIIPHYFGDSNHSKNLFLENINGTEVFKTEDPNLFRLSDGSILRKKKCKSIALRMTLSLISQTGANVIAMQEPEETSTKNFNTTDSVI